MALANILIVEDDEAIRQGVADALEYAGYGVCESGDGEDGLERACSGAIDLVLLDILMPKMDGFTMLGELRKAKPALPVIMLTARGEQEDKVKGLRLGADDYVVKPFGPDELLARVEAVLRRSAELPVERSTIEIGGRRIDFERREIAHQDGSICSMSERETEVLRYLAASGERPVSRDELLTRVWGIDPRGLRSRTVDMTIARIREHLRDDSNEPSVIATVRGKGYMLAKESGA